MPPATTWTFDDVYRFRGGSDGFYPSGGMTLGPNGVLFGATQNGGVPACQYNLGCGTVFSLTPPESGIGLWTKTTLYVFQGGSDGASPSSGVTIGPGGVLYGATAEGGGSGCGGVGCGTLYQLAPPSAPGGTWSETVLHAFTNGYDGAVPYSAPAVDSTGVVYGFALGGEGTSCLGAGCGVVFQYVP